ncbi:unnamed protein product, partial [marine sediment metagenome]
GRKRLPAQVTLIQSEILNLKSEILNPKLYRHDNPLLLERLALGESLEHLAD